DDGPADFPSIVQAAQSSAVAPGDILLVAPGTYVGFSLGKPLTICGPALGPRPVLTSPLVVTAQKVELARLTLPGLQLQAVKDGATIEDCVVQGSTSQQIGLLANQSQPVLVSRSLVRGLSPPSGTGGLGVLAVNSKVVL